MAIRPSILAGPNEKDRAKLKTAADPDFASGSPKGIHGKPALDPAYIEEQRKDIDRPNGLGNHEDNGAKDKTDTNTSTGTDTLTGTTTDTNTSTNASYDDLLAKYEELLKQFDELSKSRAVEGHNIYKNQMSSAPGYTDDFAKWLQDVRDLVMKEAQANPLETDWGKGILDYYGVLGENSANAVNAATAGENAGNIDSFAAANAERQRLSRYGQGVQTIMGMGTERFNNMLAGLESIGVNTERLFGAQGGLVDTARQYATDLYNTDATTTMAYEELMAMLEGNKTYTYDLSNEAVTSALKKVYGDLNVMDGDFEDIDWSTTDGEKWTEVMTELKKIPQYSGLTDDYLRDLITQIMKEQSTQTSGQDNVWWNVPNDTAT